MKRKFITCLLLCTAFLAQAQSNKINFTEYTLDNGLHVILQPDKSTPIVAVSVMYHVGSKNEQSNRTGFAHFFEHLMFEGSENIKRGEYANLVQTAGGSFNANTTQDRTYYYEVLPSNQLALGLWLESERMRSAKIDEAGVETQRNVIKEEKKERIDNQPYGTILEKTFANAFSEHPYRWVPIGSAQYIDQASLSEFIDFYKTFYVPNNATLSIAGDIDINQAKELIQKYFSPIPKGTKEIPRLTVKEQPKTQEVREIVFDNVQLPAVVQAYHIPEQTNPDYYAITMLTNLLTGGESSRLNKALVDQQQKAVYVGAFPMQLEDPGLFLAFAVANAGVNIDEVERSMDAEIERVKKEQISEEEFQKLRNQIENTFVQKNFTAAGRAEQLANYYLFYKDTNLINTELQNFLKVTKEDLARVANQYFTRENRVVLHYLPKSNN
ncbi:M16 family metallopeptidase [Adhaeribacter radiodurans]|uniref:Insulinase family protein n=1 Tax=Adhaeribacter radiodurans TaxID=2745197 RepID=A0A7L7LD49_9BACT|nr:pitrilysin family protein [Adhaeribacter radiodurans]QMU30768.1 insulinase family protein [Adhaeribacter radiodurans]